MARKRAGSEAARAANAAKGGSTKKAVSAKVMNKKVAQKKVSTELPTRTSPRLMDKKNKAAKEVAVFPR